MFQEAHEISYQERQDKLYIIIIVHRHHVKAESHFKVSYLFHNLCHAISNGLLSFQILHHSPSWACQRSSGCRPTGMKGCVGGGPCLWVTHGPGGAASLKWGIPGAPCRILCSHCINWASALSWLGGGGGGAPGGRGWYTGCLTPAEQEPIEKQ